VTQSALRNLKFERSTAYTSYQKKTFSPIVGAKIMNEQPSFVSQEYYTAWEYYERHRQDLRQAFIGWAGFSLKAVLLLNGAAALAILALVGHLATGDLSQTQPIISAVTPSLQWFLLGVGCATLAGGSAYFGDAFFLETTIDSFDMISVLRDGKMPLQKPVIRRTGQTFLALTIIFWITSLSMFALGAYSGTNGILASA
jgi:hypothetical protein